MMRGWWWYLVGTGGKNQKTEPPYGADVLRLWVSSVDYSGDVSVGPNILRQVCMDAGHEGPPPRGCGRSTCLLGPSGVLSWLLAYMPCLQISDAYRKLRNTARYLIGNLHDYDPTKHEVRGVHLLSLVDSRKGREGELGYASTCHAMLAMMGWMLIGLLLSCNHVGAL